MQTAELDNVRIPRISISMSYIWEWDHEAFVVNNVMNHPNIGQPLLASKLAATIVVPGMDHEKLGW